MKIYYELEQKEKDKYREEFNQLSFTKMCNGWRFMTVPFMLFSVIISVILDDFIEQGYNLAEFTTILDNLLIVMIILFVVFSVILDISFVRWLKLKHKIEY